MKSSILKVTSMRKLTSLVGDVLLDFINMIFIKIYHIHKISDVQDTILKILSLS